MEFPESEGNSSYGALSIPTATDPSFIRRHIDSRKIKENL